MPGSSEPTTASLEDFETSLAELGEDHQLD